MLTAFGQVAIANARWPSANSQVSSSKCLLPSDQCPVPESQKRETCAFLSSPCSVLRAPTPQSPDRRSPIPSSVPHSSFKCRTRGAIFDSLSNWQSRSPKNKCGKRRSSHGLLISDAEWLYGPSISICPRPIPSRLMPTSFRFCFLRLIRISSASQAAATLHPVLPAKNIPNEFGMCRGSWES